MAWFGAATLYFGLLPSTAVTWITRPRDRERQGSSLLLATLKHTLRFLGGMNAGMLALSVMLRAARGRAVPLFAAAAERRILYLAFAVGHFSQWLLNVPVAAAGGLRKNLTIQLILVVDFAMAVLNCKCAADAKDDDAAAAALADCRPDGSNDT